MKLISLSEYIELQEKQIPYDNSGTIAQYDRMFVRRVISYQRFLKKELMLGMFVPFDEGGNVLEEPSPDNYNWGYLDELIIYNKAKEKVLFKDDIFFIRNCGKYGISVEIDKGKEYVYNSKGRNDNLIVEDLIKYNVELTESALKQIGLNP